MFIVVDFEQDTHQGPHHGQKRMLIQCKSADNDIKRFHELEPHKGWHFKPVVAKMEKMVRVMHLAFKCAVLQFFVQGRSTIFGDFDEQKGAIYADTVCQDASNLAGPTGTVGGSHHNECFVEGYPMFLYRKNFSFTIMGFT